MPKRRKAARKGHGEIRYIGGELQQLREEVKLQFGFPSLRAADAFIASRYREMNELAGLGRKGLKEATEVLFGSGGFR